MKLKKAAAALAGVAILAAAGPAGAADKPDVLVSWANGAITKSDFEAATRNLSGRDRAYVLSDMKRITKVIDYLMVNREMAKEALADGLQKNPVNAALIQQRHDQVLAQLEADKIRHDAKLPDFAVVAHEYYLTHPQQFMAPEKVELAHILITTHGRTDAEALALAKKVRSEALAGKDFGKLAEKYSEDKGSAAKKGDLGWVQHGQMVKPFEDAAFALKKVGDISPIVKTRFGYHIIKLLGRHKKAMRPFDEVKQELIAKEKKHYLNGLVMAHVNEIRNRKDIVIHKKALDALLIKLPNIPDDHSVSFGKPKK